MTLPCPTGSSRIAGRPRVSATPRISPLKMLLSLPGKRIRTLLRVSSVGTRSSGPPAQRTGTTRSE